MWLYTLTTLIVCLQMQDVRTEPVSVNIAATASVSASSSLVYGSYNFNPENVIDGNNQTTPDTCNCCWASVNEPTPNITLLLPQKYLVTSIEIIGRSDHMDAPRILTGVNIAVDGVDMTHDQHLVGNTTIHLDITQSVSNITVTRPRPVSQTKWYLYICEIKVYSPAVSIVAEIGKTNVHVEQSSFLYNNETVFGPQNAIDGTGSERIRLCYCCSVTNNPGSVSWWQVDLKQQYLVWAIQISGRLPDASSAYNDQLQDAVVYAGNTSLKQNQQHGVIIYTVPRMSTTVRNFTKAFDKAIISQFFLVKLNRTVLSLCEFKMFTAVCSKGFYGNVCTKPCNDQCYDGCYRGTGICYQGCKAGYMGPYCNITCNFGFYGPNCTQLCGSCKDNHACNKTNGVCENGCETGYDGTKCIPCPDGFYGDGCSGRCHCKDGVDCLKNNGTCQNGCEFGWDGDSCSTDLNIIARNKQNITTSQSSVFLSNTSMFGPQNAIDGVDNYDVDNCGCCSVTNNPGTNSWWQIDLGQQYLVQALQIYGRISGVNEQLEGAIIYAGNTSLIHSQYGRMKIYTVPTMTDTTRHFTKILDNAIISQYFLVELKYLLTLCEFKLFAKACDVGRFGFGCSHFCHCHDNQTCNAVTGECQTPGCYPGWRGTACDQKCVSPTFGSDCGKECHCINGTRCGHVSEHCDLKQCDPGWYGQSCDQECMLPTFGINCGNICRCIDGTECDHVTGRCDKGQCDPGWQGDSCSQECVSPTFGSDCGKECHCINGTHCGYVSGHCDLKQCDPGWYGQSCDQESISGSLQSVSQSNTIPVVVGGAVGGVFVLLIVVSMVVVYRKRAGFGNKSTHDTHTPTDINQPTHEENANNEGTSYSEIESRYVNIQSHGVSIRGQSEGDVTYYNVESASVYDTLKQDNLDSSTYSSLKH